MSAPITVEQARAAVVDHFDSAVGDAAFAGGDPDDYGFGVKLDDLIAAVSAESSAQLLQATQERDAWKRTVTGPAAECADELLRVRKELEMARASLLAQVREIANELDQVLKRASFYQRGIDFDHTREIALKLATFASEAPRSRSRLPTRKDFIP